MTLGVTTVLTVLGFVLADAPVAERFLLKNGSRLEGPVVEATAEVVTLDLGFQKVSIPLAEVTLRAPASAPESAPTNALPTVQPVPTGPLVPADGGSASVAPPTTVSSPLDIAHGQLWHDVAGLTLRSLDDNVKAVAEAVVLVRTPVGLGSGFVIHAEGYVVTNDHVIQGSNELTVVVYRKATDGLHKDEYKKIRIVAMSELLDLALLKIETEKPETFVTVPLGDSAVLTQGENVFAIGNPMGLERTLSEGIVGVRSRLLSGQTYLQVTAPISPGNSGGPLFNRKGEVVGVNTLKVVAMGAEGLGFSIPVNRVKAFLADQEAFAFDPLNANAGFRYYPPPSSSEPEKPREP